MLSPPLMASLLSLDSSRICVSYSLYSVCVTARAGSSLGSALPLAPNLLPSTAPPLYQGDLELLPRGPETSEILTSSRSLLLTHSSLFPTSSGTFSRDVVAIVTALL